MAPRLRALPLILGLMSLSSETSAFETVIELPWQDGAHLRQVVTTQGCAAEIVLTISEADGRNGVVLIEDGRILFELNRIDYDACQELVDGPDGPVLGCRSLDAEHAQDAYWGRMRELLDQGPSPGLDGPAAVVWLHRRLTQEMAAGALGEVLAKNRFVAGSGAEAIAYPLDMVLLFGPGERTRPVIEQVRRQASRTCSEP